MDNRIAFVENEKIQAAQRHNLQTAASFSEEQNPFPSAAEMQNLNAPAQNPDAEKTRKAIFSRQGYELPETMQTKYSVREGKFYDFSTDSLRFEDSGKTLTTVVEDRAVIKDMLAVATAKNWGAIEVKGTERFRQQVWLEARTLGLEVKGYEPNPHDLSLLTQRLPTNNMAFNQKQPTQEQISVQVAKALLERSLATFPNEYRDKIMRQFEKELQNGLQLPVPLMQDKGVVHADLMENSVTESKQNPHAVLNKEIALER